MDPPELPVAQLVRLTGLFGISENRARVALSRMVAGGEATSDGSGRYRLAGHLAARQSRQSASRAGLTTGSYDGEWWLAVVTTTGSSADVRGARRRTLAYGRLAELREGVWMRPANLAVRTPRLPGRRHRAHDGATGRTPAGWRSGSGTCPRGRHGRVTCWASSTHCTPTGPTRWRRVSSSRPRCCGTCRRIPLLPAELLPAAWPGAALRATYDEWDARYRATLRDWSRAG